MSILNKVLLPKNLFIVFFSTFLLGLFLGSVLFYESPSISDDSDKVQSFLDIYLNNLFVNLLIIISGIFSLGIIPTFIIFVNGFYLGTFLIINFIELNLFHFISLIFFHGPIELLGLSFGYVLSIIIPWSLIKKIWKHDFLTTESNSYKKYLRYFIYSVFLLLLASIIEYVVIIFN